MRFEGTSSYVAADDLTVAVNAAIALERPLLVKGEPGTGKTELAKQVAASLNLPLIEWHVKSTTDATCTSARPLSTAGSHRKCHLHRQRMSSSILSRCCATAMSALKRLASTG